ncbi:MAG: FG-GAP-like repeat-containing protein [Terracidiphilus sp.]
MPFAFSLTAIFLLPLGPALAVAQTPIFPVTTFQTLSEYDSGPFALAYLTPDKKPDLVYWAVPAYNVAPELYVLLDIGNSSSTPSTISINGCTMGSGTPAIGDVDQDGNQDLVVPCQGYLAVLLGNGDGTFKAPTFYAGNFEGSPILVDLNGDKYPDIVTTTTGTSTSSVTVLLNGGSGSPGGFASPVNYPVPAGTGISAIQVGDFNGDGKPDVFAGSGTSAQLFLGNGDGTVQAAQSVPLPGTSVGGTPAINFAAGDFNQDGITDIAYILETNGSSDQPTSVQILLGSSSGVFTQGATIPFGPGFVNLTSAVLTSSGTTDLILTGYDDNNTVILHGDGKGNFAISGGYAAVGVPLVADVNGDGIPDLLLIGNAPGNVVTLLGNGNGTFQGVPSAAINDTQIYGTSSPTGVVAADFNNDGIEDVANIAPQGSQSVISVDLGRGDGTFAPVDATTPNLGSFLVAGDFNHDGKMDLVSIAAGTSTTDAQLYFYAGNGNGTFQPAGPAVDLGSGVTGAVEAVTGDFNGDGKLDLIVAYGVISKGLDPLGLVFIPGNGDGAFGTPVSLSQSPSGLTGPLFAADLNQDGKLDLVWQNGLDNAVFLGNGDGTFKQIQLNLSLPNGETILAVADLNGDGIPDLAVEGQQSGGGDYYLNLYAGIGDGTFQTTPFSTLPLPVIFATPSLAVGDINGDGNPDLAVYNSNATYSSQVSVFYGDGKGDFTVDPNIYFAGYTQTPGQVFLTRLNNQAPALPGDNTLDALVFTGTSLTALLNQTNPTPTAPSPIATSVSLQASSTSASENASITLTATVVGLTPTSTVTFSANGSSLGTGTLSGGVATLMASFASAGTYAVTANYAGDSNNAASVSSSVSITVAAPDFSIASSPTSATITAGQSTIFTLTLTPAGGYTGTVSLACGTMPSQATCTFNPTSLTPTSATAVTSTLTIATTGPSSSANTQFHNRPSPWLPTGALTLAGLLGIAFSPRRLRKWASRMSAIAVLSLFAALCISGCGSGSKGNQQTGTPPGTYSIVVTVADSAGGPQHNISLNVIVQ